MNTRRTMPFYFATFQLTSRTEVVLELILESRKKYNIFEKEIRIGLFIEDVQKAR